MLTSGKASVHVEATPDRLYRLVADVTRIGEYSPECRKARWLDGSDRAAPGARFRGDNVATTLLRWSRTCEVLVADTGREFTFRTLPTWRYRDSTVWSYRLRPSGTGTDVTESYEVVLVPPRPVMAAIRRLLPHHLDMRPHLVRTLEALKRSAEAGVRGSPAPPS
ncbi:SRPBCC family protein [Pseudonocardia saturnea]